MCMSDNVTRPLYSVQAPVIDDRCIHVRMKCEPPQTSVIGASPSSPRSGDDTLKRNNRHSIACMR